MVAIRGLAGVDANAFADQAVSFSIDGVQIARSSVRRLSEMDTAQIDILKGPQALFFGKNSPAGVISIRTGDPTPTFSAMLSSGYEFNADETRTEGYVSTPISDTLGVRVAGFYDHMEGYVRNIAPSTGPGIFPVLHDRVPYGREYAGRLTLKWKPSADFDARLKASYSDRDGSGGTDNTQLVACPLGVPQSNTPIDTCKADAFVTTSNNIGPNFGLLDPRYGSGQTYLRTNQTLVGLDMNYRINDHFTLSSITGYYRSFNTYVGSFAANYQETGTAPKQIRASYSLSPYSQYSQELRLTSSLKGPVNFLIGGYFVGSNASVVGAMAINALTPSSTTNYIYKQNGIAYSVFGQTTVKFIPQLELSVGARYSYERKKLPLFRAATTAAPFTLIDVDSINRASFNNLSPEVSLSYRPTGRLTIYGGYKEGFLSGGFNAAQPSLGPVNPATGHLTSLVNPAYQQQLTSGFEGGVKASLLHGSLRTNLALYSYNTTGLQVTVSINGISQLSNAGSVRTKGVEFDATYRTPLKGLTLNGAVSYERGRYTDYQANCYRGLPAPTCVTQVNRFTGAPGLYQDLSGTQLVRAPEWTGNIGLDYLSPVFSGVRLGFNANASHSDSYFTDVTSTPGSREKAYELYDAGIRLEAANDRWELALIGRNLGDTYYFDRSADTPTTGTAPGGSAATAIRGDTVAVPSRGREIWLKATIRFGN